MEPEVSLPHSQVPATCPRIFFFFGGGFNKFSWGQRAERTGIWGRQPPSQGFRSICKRVKPVFLLGCFGCIFHGTGNSAWLCQNCGISGGGVWNPPSVRHCPELSISPGLRLSLCTFRNMTRFYGDELLAPRPTTKLEDLPVSAVRVCLFNIFAAALHIVGRSSIRNLRTRHAVITGTYLSSL
jgi:hypothetical protein